MAPKNTLTQPGTGIFVSFLNVPDKIKNLGHDQDYNIDLLKNF